MSQMRVSAVSAEPARQAVSRRTLLLGPLALPLAGCATSKVAATGPGDTSGDGSDRGRWCVDSSSMTQHGSIGSARLVYDVTGQASPFGFDEAFHRQLTRWLADWNQRSRYGAVQQIWTFGAYVEGGSNCHSYHAAGRALDIARLRSGGRTLVSCRTDLWGSMTASEQAGLNRRYWTLAASLHQHFAYVLTHYYDSAHDNHIHVDNGRSGGDMSVFDPESQVQCQAVQAISTHIWGRPAEVTGRWDDTGVVASVLLREVGRRGDLTRGDNWQALLGASVTRG